MLCGGHKEQVHTMYIDALAYMNDDIMMHIKMLPMFRKVEDVEACLDIK